MSDDPAESVTEPTAEGDSETNPDADTSAQTESETVGAETENGESTAESVESAGPTDSVDEQSETVSTRVAEYDDELADEVSALESRISALEAERDEATETASELETRLKRTQADFQNYKKRAKKRQDQIKDRATEDFVERVVTVRDNLVRALDQDEDADIRDGLESTLKEFDRILEDENVEIIDPEPGTDVDPTRHEVMMRVDSDQPASTIASVFQPGYEMADKVIRAAQVTVSKEE